MSKAIATLETNDETYVYDAPSLSCSHIAGAVISQICSNLVYEPPSTTTTTGSFTRDPIGYRGGFDLYEFVAGKPFKAVDPSGREGWIPGPTVGGVYYPYITPGTHLPGHPHSQPLPSPPSDSNRVCGFDPGCAPCKLSVKMFCRTMPSAGNVSFLRHCYLAVQNDDGRYISTIAGQRDEDTGMVVFADEFWDLNHLNDDPLWVEVNGDTDDTENLLFNTGRMDGCAFAQCACEAAKRLHGTFTYMQAWQNSNTFLSRVISACGGAARFPGSAIAGTNVGNPNVPSNPHYPTHFPYVHPGSGFPVPWQVPHR